MVPAASAAENRDTSTHAGSNAQSSEVSTLPAWITGGLAIVVKARLIGFKVGQTIQAHGKVGL
ncbi:MAG: hypothetical protein R2932_58585 [Caldilineaceae bacterium]